MKIHLLSLLLLISAPFASAQDSFPGLKSVLTAAEWQRAGLARLTPDEIGVIDAALIRQQGRTTAQLQTDLSSARQSANVASNSAPGAPAPRGWLERFGFPVFNDSDWRNMTPLRAKVTGWDGGNRFKLDNGQIWEGFEPITYELPNKEIEIQARPHGQYALVVDGKNTTIRVMRLR